MLSQLRDEDNKPPVPAYPNNRNIKKNKVKAVVKEEVKEMRYVRSVRLDEIVPPDIVIDLVKIDVEGTLSLCYMHSLLFKRRLTHLHSHTHQ